MYEVDRARDGGSFSNRRVVAIQHGRPILNLAASFQEPEEGLEHQAVMPDVPAASQCEDILDRRIGSRSEDAGKNASPYGGQAGIRNAAGCAGSSRRMLPSRPSGCGPLTSCRQIQPCIAICWPMLPTTSFSVPRRFRMTCHLRKAGSSWPAWITRSGFTGKYASTSGSCIRSTARTRQVLAASRAANSSMRLASLSPRRRRKACCVLWRIRVENAATRSYKTSCYSDLPCAATAAAALATASASPRNSRDNGFRSSSSSYASGMPVGMLKPVISSSEYRQAF